MKEHSNKIKCLRLKEDIFSEEAAVEVVGKSLDCTKVAIVICEVESKSSGVMVICEHVGNSLAANVIGESSDCTPGVAVISEVTVPNEFGGKSSV